MLVRNIPKIFLAALSLICSGCVTQYNVMFERSTLAKMPTDSVCVEKLADKKAATGVILSSYPDCPSSSEPLEEPKFKIKWTDRMFFSDHDYAWSVAHGEPTAIKSVMFQGKQITPIRTLIAERDFRVLSKEGRRDYKVYVIPDAAVDSFLVYYEKGSRTKTFFLGAAITGGICLAFLAVLGHALSQMR